MTSARLRAWRLFALVALVVGAARLSAHEVVVEQIVEATFTPRQATLVVTLHVPTAAVGDPGLPGLLQGNDAAAIEERLRIVAADIARNLDVQQADTNLPAPVATVRPGSGGASIDVELRYPAGSEARSFSARLNGFNSNTGPVRTNARYQPESGRDQMITVTGPPTRVAFDPPLAGVISGFAVRGVRALIDGGDHLLFLLCVLLPMRRPRSAVMIYAAAVLGQLAAMALSFATAPLTAPWLPAAAMAAASAIAMTALLNITRARMAWVLLLAVSFGALNGCAFGDTAVSSVQFAGSHGFAAALAFVAVVLIGELWIGTLSWALRVWVDDRGLPDRIVTVVGSVIVAHSALHRVMERAPLVAQDGGWDGGRVVLWLTLIWIAVLLLAAAGQAIAGAPQRAHAS
jgi:hypothetical protein